MSQAGGTRHLCATRIITPICEARKSPNIEEPSGYRNASGFEVPGCFCRPLLLTDHNSLTRYIVCASILVNQFCRWLEKTMKILRCPNRECQPSGKTVS